jgi:two-component system chemotaxis response regulator CheB
LEVDAGDPVCAQRPSGTVLFDSMAHTLGSSALGVLLTGMGEDGAEGLLHLRRSGAYTIAEDESTAVVYGMPKEAVRLGGVCESLPLPAIAGRLLELTQSKREVA